MTIDVSTPRDEVYNFLDVMANHEPFTNHMMREWEYSGPDRGIGSKARVKVSAGGRTDTIDIEVISADPATIVERNIGAGGRRIATGTYTLEDLPSGGTRIVFEYASALTNTPRGRSTSRTRVYREALPASSRWWMARDDTTASNGPAGSGSEKS